MKLIGKKVKIFLKNGLSAEGIVVEWSDGKSILKSLNSDNILIINNCHENIIMTNVFSSIASVCSEPIDEDRVQEREYVEKQSINDFQELSENKDKFEDLLLSRKQNIINDLKRHMHAVPNQVNYGYPGFSKWSSRNDPAKKSDS